MLSMDEIYLIKELARQGLSARQIAETLKYDRATVRKYLKQVNVAPATIIKVRRSSVMDPYIEGIRDLLLSEKANTSRKHYLTARRIYDMVNEGQIAPGVPSKSISLRTVERTVGLLRREINRKINRQHLKLEHSPGWLRSTSARSWSEPRAVRDASTSWSWHSRIRIFGWRTPCRLRISNAWLMALMLCLLRLDGFRRFFVATT